MCKAHRDTARLKQREVAERVGVKDSTYANVESSPHRIVGRDRALALAKVFELDEAATASFMAAWEAQPLSEYGEKHRAAWEKRNKLRAKGRNHDKLQLALVEVLGVLIARVDQADLCTCDPGGGTREDPARNCEVCSALEALGIDPLLGGPVRAAMLPALNALQDKLEEARTARIAQEKAARAARAARP